MVLREVTIDDEELINELVSSQGELPLWAQRSREHAKRYALVRNPGKTVRRRIDILLINHKKSSVKIPRERIALEIKVSRSDFLSETDEKRAPWRRFADKFAYVAPEGMIKPSELPEGCGLLEYRISKWGTPELVWKKTAKAYPTVDRSISPNFGHYLLTRLHEAERKLRRLTPMAA